MLIRKCDPRPNLTSPTWVTKGKLRGKTNFFCGGGRANACVRGLAWGEAVETGEGERGRAERGSDVPGRLLPIKE